MAAQILRGNNRSIAELFEEWISANAPTYPSAIAIEGLPGSGKSELIKRLPTEKYDLFELDKLLENTEYDELPWLDVMIAERAHEKIFQRLTGQKILVIEGPQAWAFAKLPGAMNWSAPLVRVYMRRISTAGGLEDWLDFDCEKSSSLNLQRSTFLKSIYDCHLNERPWERADLLIDRLDD